MTARIETTARATSIPMVVPQALPITSRGLQKLLKTARTRVTNSDTVGEYKKVLAAQQKVTELMVPALLIHMKYAEGVDLPALIPNWRSLEITITGTWNAGDFHIVEWVHDERLPSTKGRTWTVSKSVLLKEMVAVSAPLSRVA